MSPHEKKQYFFKHVQMDFETQIVLGSCCYGAAEAGEILAITESIKNGDFESWYQAWYAAGERVQAMAEEIASAGNRVSAAHTYLRAASYFSASITMIDGTKDTSRGVPIWKRHLECWEKFCSFLTPPAEKVEIPYEDTPMHGYFFKPDDSPGRWPVVIFNNGSDGTTSTTWVSGVAGALERGYAALVFDGPGQNAMLWLNEVPFRYDWEKVITPVTDFLLARDDVDGERIALSGISQGGYWVLRALAFEHRIAAGILDPGVMDVATTMVENFPRRMLELMEQGNEEEFNKEMEFGMKLGGKSRRQELEWRMKPYMTDNYFKWLTEAMKFNARDVVTLVQCPVWISDPEDEQFWPGQSQEVYDRLECPKTIQKFTREEGANWHCEPKARALYDQRMFDWLATVMPPR